MRLAGVLAKADHFGSILQGSYFGIDGFIVSRYQVFLKEIQTQQKACHPETNSG